jgi:hypothetical protein
MNRLLALALLLASVSVASAQGVAPREGRFLTMGTNSNHLLVPKKRNEPEIQLLVKAGVPPNVAQFWTEQYENHEDAARAVERRIEEIDQRAKAAAIGRVSSQMKATVYSDTHDRYLFPSEIARQSEQNDLKDKKASLLAELAVAGRPIPNFPQLGLKPAEGAIGHLGKFTVLHVIDGDEALINVGNETLLVRGVPTEKLIDDRSYTSNRMMKASGTYRYESALGTNTVLVLKPVDDAAISKLVTLYRPPKFRVER